MKTHNNFILASLILVGALFLLTFVSADAPVITITVPNQTVFSTQPINLTISSDIIPTSCEYTTDSGATNTTFTYPSASISGLTFGTHYILNVSCADELGNTGTASTEFDFTAGTSPEEMLSWLYLFIFGISIFLFVVGYKSENILFIFSSGILFLVGGIYLMINGIPGVTDVLTTIGSGVIFVGIGMYLIIMAGYGWLQNESGSLLDGLIGGDDD